MAEALALCSGSFPTDRLALFLRDLQKLLVVVVSFHSFPPREVEDEEHEEHEELGDFQLVTDDNAFDSEEVQCGTLTEKSAYLLNFGIYLSVQNTASSSTANLLKSLLFYSVFVG